MQFRGNAASLGSRSETPISLKGDIGVNVGPSNRPELSLGG